MNYDKLALKSVLNCVDTLLDKSGELATQSKESQRDIVTSFDLLIEKNMIENLKPSGLKIIAEETATKTSKEGLCWVLDPIDGTVNFIHDLDYFGISLGLVDFKNPKKIYFKSGVISLPKIKSNYFTLNNCSFKNGKKLKAINTQFKDSLITACFSGKSNCPEKRSLQYKIFGLINDFTRGCLRMGSAAAQIAFTVENKITATYGFDAKIWDIAGGLALATYTGHKTYISQGTCENSYNFIVGAHDACDQIKSILEGENLCQF